jgi:hypothetical protein
VTTPQQPEIARSRRSAITPTRPAPPRGKKQGAGGGAGPVPEANAPGHHPEVEQDKPIGRPRSMPERFEFAFDRAFVVPAAVVGVTRWTASVAVSGKDLVIRFGPWVLRTPRENIAGTELSGPYQTIKVIGPPHLSFADRGVTFATNRDRGVCIRFHKPVPALTPFALVRHPAATVTVADVDGLVEALR